MHRFQSAILGILQEETRLIVQAEKLKARQFVSPNGTVHSDPTGSEFWFYCIDPASDLILTNNHHTINSTLLSTESLNQISSSIATKLRIDVSEIRPPLAEPLVQTPPSQPPPPSPGVITAKLWEGFPVALIAVGIVVFLFAFGGTIYICVSWKRYHTFTQPIFTSFSREFSLIGR